MFRNSMRPGLVLGITPETLSFGAAGLTVATSNVSVWPKATEAPSQEAKPKPNCEPAQRGARHRSISIHRFVYYALVDCDKSRGFLL
jgi:hypothetical protein